MRRVQTILACGLAIAVSTTAFADFTPVPISYSDSSSGGWSASFGTGYAVIYGFHTTGNLMSTDLTGTLPLANTNIEYQGGLSADLAVNRNFNNFVGFGLSYSYLTASADPGSPIVQIGGASGAGQPGAYRSAIAMHSFFLNLRLMAHNAITLGGSTEMTPFISGGAGLTLFQMYDQNYSQSNGTVRNTLQSHFSTALAYTGTAGVMTRVNQSWSIDWGVRGTYLGEYNSGTVITDYGAPLKEAVQADLYAIEPFINATYYFNT